MKEEVNGNYYMQTPATDSGEFDIKRWASELTEDAITSGNLNIKSSDSLNGMLKNTKITTPKSANLVSRVADWDRYKNAGYSDEEILGDVQRGYERFGNALLNNLVIAGTTAVQSSLGLTYGILNGIAGNSVWDNPINNAMNNIQENARENNPIYHSKEYNNASTIGRFFTTEFWADNLQNLGFTEGMLISSLVPGALLKNAGVAANIIGKSLLSSFGEASTEALNAKNDKKNLEYQQAINNYNQDKLSLAGIPDNIKQERELELYEDLQNTLAGIENDANKVGNAVLYQNMAILTLTGAGEFAPLFSRGAKASAVAANNKLLQRGIKSTLDDTGRLAEVAMKEGKGLFIAKDIAKTVGRATLEGVEEFSQNVATKVGDLYEGYNSFNNSRFNPEKRELATSLLQAGSMAIAEAVHDKDVWTEFLSGMVTGFTGSPMIRSPKNSEGKWQSPVTLEGAVAEGIRDFSEYNRRSSVVNSINERLQDPKFQEYYEHLTRDIALSEKMNAAIENADAFNLKNYQLEKVVSDIALFEQLGLIDEYKSTVSSFANLDDAQLQSIIDETTVDGNGPFVDNGRTMRVDEVRDKIKENTNFILSKIDRFIDIKNTANLFLNPKLSKNALENYIYGSMQIEDWQNRQRELLNELYTIYSENAEEGTVVPKEELAKKPTAEVNKILSSVYDNLNPNDKIEYNKKVRDFNKLSESIRIFNEKLQEVVKNPEKENKKTAKREEANAKEAKTYKGKSLEGKLATAASFSDIKNILNDETIDAATKDKALRASANQVAKDYNKLLQSVKATRVKAAQLSDAQLKSDINKILDNLVDNAETLKDLDPEGLLVADPEILRTDSAENSDDLFERSQKAVQVIKGTFGDTMKTNEEPIIEVTEVDDNVPAPDFDDEGTEESTTGNQGVPTAKPVNSPANLKEEGRTAVTDGVEVSVGEDNAVDSYLSKEEVGAIQQDIEAKSKEETRDIQENTSKREGDKETLIRPSTSQYDLTGMTRNPNGVSFNEVPEAGRAARQHLAQNGPEGKDAFEWINEGGLQQYLQNKGKLYVGIDPRFSETTPVIFIKNQDNTYSPIAILWESDNKIDSFAGLREITDKVREEYQSNKVENTPYISPNIEIPAENVNVTSGRVAYTNRAKHLVKDAIEGSEISSDSADILVIANGNLVGGTGKARDYRISGSGNSGMAYISIPNARRGGFKGNTLVPIIPKSYSEVKDGNGIFVTKVKATIQKLAESLSKGDIDTYKADLKKLGNYLTLSYLDVGYQKDENGNAVKFFFKQIERNPDGSVVKVERNGKEVVKSSPISSVDVGASVEEISAAIENALTQLQVPIRVNKSFVGKNLEEGKKYNQVLIEEGLVETYATRLKSEAAYFTFTAPTVQQAPIETTTEGKQGVKSAELSTSDDLFGLDNFGISDTLNNSNIQRALLDNGIFTQKEYEEFIKENSLNKEKSEGFLFNFIEKVLNINPRNKLGKLNIPITVQNFYLEDTTYAPYDTNGIIFSRVLGFVPNGFDLNDSELDSKLKKYLDEKYEEDLGRKIVELEVPNKNISNLYKEIIATQRKIEAIKRYLKSKSSAFEEDKSVVTEILKGANKRISDNQYLGYTITNLTKSINILRESLQKTYYKQAALRLKLNNRMLALHTIEDVKDLMYKRIIAERDSYRITKKDYASKIKPFIPLYEKAQKASITTSFVEYSNPIFIKLTEFGTVNEEGILRGISIERLCDILIEEVPKLKPLLELAKKVNPKVTIDIYSTEAYNSKFNINKLEQGASHFSPKTNTISYATNISTDVIIHELIHSISSYGLIGKGNNESSLGESVIQPFIDYLVTYLKEHVGNYGPIYLWGVKLSANIYGFTNPAEFIAELFSNEGFQELLDSIPAMENKKYESLLHQIVSKILDFVRKIFAPKTTPTALDQAKELALSVIRTQQIHKRTIYTQLEKFKNQEQENHYMRPQPKYLGSPQEISKIIESNRYTYSVNRDYVQNAVNRINEAAGKTIARLGRGSLHEGIQAYKVDIIEEPTMDMLNEAHYNSLLEFSKAEMRLPLTEHEIERLKDMGHSDTFIETVDEDTLKYLGFCKEF